VALATLIIKLTYTAPSRGWQSIVFILTLGVSLSACSSTTWREEVALHDGSKIIVTRTNTYDPSGLREPFQPDPLKESTLTFTVPGTKQKVTWRSDYGRGNHDNLSLLLLDFLNGTPYIATHPAFCHGYNKWERPNPPYVFFKHEEEWKRIPLEQFPTEFKEANILLAPISNESVKRQILDLNARDGYASHENIKKLNRDSEKEYRTIAREPIKTATTQCEELIFYKCGWISPKGNIGRDFMDKVCK
jgi:hypothetical protein